MNQVDKERVPCPHVRLGPEAYRQLMLMQENDFTIGSKYFRVVISGKGCDGFTYACGLTDLKEDDFEILAHTEDGQEFVVVMDPFAAFYLQDCTVDYMQDVDTGAEGLVVINHAQEKYAGKFWKQSPTDVPPLKENLITS